MVNCHLADCSSNITVLAWCETTDGGQDLSYNCKMSLNVLHTSNLLKLYIFFVNVIIM